MKKFGRWVLQSILIAGSLFLLWAIVHSALIHIVSSVKTLDLLFPMMMAVALTLRIFTHFGLSGSKIVQLFDFIDTLEHELTHAIVATAFASPPKSLKVTQNQGGEVSLDKSNLCIALAPYCLPLWSLLGLGISWITPASQRTYWLFLPWSLLGMFLFRLFREFRPYQTDFKESGFVSALLVSVIAIFLYTSILLTISTDLNWKWFFSLPSLMWQHLDTCYTYILNLLQKR